MSQLALPLRLADHAIFETYLATGNEALVDYLRSLTSAAPGQGAWIWGAPATGKSHLLQAACERFGDRAAYVPLQALAGAGTGVLEGLEYGVQVGTSSRELPLSTTLTVEAQQRVSVY